MVPPAKTAAFLPNAAPQYEGPPWRNDNGGAALREELIGYSDIFAAFGAAVRNPR